MGKLLLLFSIKDRDELETDLNRPLPTLLENIYPSSLFINKSTKFVNFFNFTLLLQKISFEKQKPKSVAQNIKVSPKVNVNDTKKNMLNLYRKEKCQKNACQKHHVLYETDDNKSVAEVYSALAKLEYIVMFIEFSVSRA
jgi:hypothetical protein